MTIYKTLPDGVNIVEYEHGMAQAVADMWNASVDSWGGDRTVRTAADIVAELKAAAYLNIYVAELNGEALGFASLSKYFRDDNALYLHVLNVRPDRHGHKLGKALVLQCVARTIELGYPRLDIHTWPGNTKAVPLYKKCGYMWEDRVDSTHLVNFIPTVLAAEASAPFFETADWYADSARVIEVKPDGVKAKQFEVFEYAWEKDGHRLAAGFERTGRRMRLLETDEYRLTLKAECHELAFGLDYGCVFEIKNKTDKPLHFRVQGKNDGNIRFDYAVDTEITGVRTFDARFFVGEITEPQDIWKVHPCVLADVYINGRHAEFGLGIETKWPVSLSVAELKKIATPGATYDAYFNLTSALIDDAEVTIKLPDAPAAVTRFADAGRTVDLPALGKTAYKVKAEAVAYGHEAVSVLFEVKLRDGRSVSFTRPMPVVSRGLTGACGYETETDYILQNGLWQLGLHKNGAYAWTNHVFDAPGGPGFPIGQLGRPYSDEFERIKPFDVRMYRLDEAMVMEASYRSKAFAGVEYTAVYTLAPGLFTRRHRVANQGGDAVTLVLKDESHPALRRHTVLPYDGGVQTIRDGLSSCAVNVDKDLIDENWAYEDDPRYPFGICWPSAYSLNIRWGDAFYFEHELALQPGESFETEPIIVAHGMFNHYRDFRDFARQTYTTCAPKATPHIDWTLNGGNPFSAAERWTAAVRQHRSALLEGTITASADGSLFEAGENHTFALTPPAAACGRVTPVSLQMRMVNFDKTWTKAVFVPQPASNVTVAECDGVFTADNGVIQFKADPRFSDACFSLVKDGHEWLMSHYPSRAPYAWFNPFIGGLNAELDRMNDAVTVRETITAAYAEETDALGNVWKGISTTVKIDKFEEHKGMSYTQYYLTLPGLPVLCYFVRLHNDTGLYKKIWLHTGAYVGHPEGIEKLTMCGEDENSLVYRFPVGRDSWERTLNRLVVVEAEQDDRLHFYRDTTGVWPLSMWMDVRVAAVEAHFPTEMENGGTFTTKPLFMILTPQELTAPMLTDLDNVSFS